MSASSLLGCALRHEAAEKDDAMFSNYNNTVGNTMLSYPNLLLLTSRRRTSASARVFLNVHFGDRRVQKKKRKTTTTT